MKQDFILVARHMAGDKRKKSLVTYMAPQKQEQEIKQVEINLANVFYSPGRQSSYGKL